MDFWHDDGPRARRAGRRGDTIADRASRSTRYSGISMSYKTFPDEEVFDGREGVDQVAPDSKKIISIYEALDTCGKIIKGCSVWAKSNKYFWFKQSMHVPLLFGPMEKCFHPIACHPRPQAAVVAYPPTHHMIMTAATCYFLPLHFLLPFQVARLSSPLYTVWRPISRDIL